MNEKLKSKLLAEQMMIMAHMTTGAYTLTAKLLEVLLSRTMTQKKMTAYTSVA